MLRQYAGRWRPWQIVFVFCLVYLTVIFALNDANVKAFVTTGSCYSSCDYDPEVGCPDGTEPGYDGQFAYYIARDPAHARRCLDVPAYRYQRILLPALGYVLSFGVDDLIPVVFVIANLIALVAGTAILEQLLMALKVNRWFALTYGLFFGVIIGVRTSTTEPLAYGLVIGAIWLSQQHNEHPWWQAVILLAAALAKETTLLFMVGFLLFYALNGRWRDAIRLALVVGVPFTLWQLYLYHSLGAFGAGSGGDMATPFELIPYNGLWRIYTETDSIALFLVVGGLAAAAAALPSAWGVWVTGRELWRRRDAHLYTCLYLVNAGIVVLLPFSTYREFIGLLRFIVGLVLTHLLFAALRYPGKRPLIYSTLWIVLLIFVVSG